MAAIGRHSSDLCIEQTAFVQPAFERFPSLESGASCDPTNPCSLVWVWKFHYISIPFMAGSAFALIAVLLFLVPRSSTR